MRENDLLDIELRIQRAARTVELLGGDKQFVECAEELLNEMRRLSDALEMAAEHLERISADEFVHEDGDAAEPKSDEARSTLEDDTDFKALVAILDDYAE
jgi:hypothetical protein